ncbi:recombinase family protein [Streptomyces sp. IBSBF 2435]|uniref:recombinase family protein n=1 Tax=Streptomyces sp. IBSBF 2435 TaxID=2903531 RepID=UPI002FDC06AE
MTATNLPRIETPGASRRVVIYCRISDDREGKRWGVDRQEKVCRERADRNGWEVIAVLIENDVSAYSGAARPKYQQLLDMLGTGEANAVLALSGKRLQRNWRDAFAFLDLAEERDIAIDTIKAGAFNLNTAEGRGQARRAAVDAQEESEEIGERVRDAKLDNVREGTYRGGPRPFGYEDGGMVVRSLLCPGCGATDGFASDRACGACGAAAVNTEGSEAWRIEQAMDALIAGDSLRSICRTWDAQGVRVPPRRYRQADGTRGEPETRVWGPVALGRTLLRARNAGLIETRGEVVGQAAWPALVSEEKWRAVTDLLKNPGRRTNLHGTARKHLGSGLYKCWCGEPLVFALTGVGGRKRVGPEGRTYRPAYRCGTGRHATRDMVALDDFVEQIAIRRLSRADAAKLLVPPTSADPSADQLAAEANSLRAKLDGYAEDYDADRITRKQMLDGTSRTRERLACVELRMARLAQVPVLASLPLGTEQIAEQWPSLPLDRKRSIIDALMTVTVGKARRGRPKGYVPGSGAGYFDPDTIAIAWKQAED